MIGRPVLKSLGTRPIRQSVSCGRDGGLQALKIRFRHARLCAGIGCSGFILAQ